MEYEVGKSILYQKTGLAKSLLALDLLSKNAGDRIQPISEYQEKFGVSRGTVQNAFTYLKECGAVVLEHHGHQGTYIEKLGLPQITGKLYEKRAVGYHAAAIFSNL